MLVFAIAVTIVQDISGRVRLEAANAERNSYIAVTRRDKVVQRLNLLAISLESCGKLFRFCADRAIRLDPLSFEPAIPAANLVPRLESAELYIRNFLVWIYVLLFLILFARRRLLILDLENRVLP